MTAPAFPLKSLLSSGTFLPPTLSMSSSRLYQSIAAQILRQIESGEFPPGSRLPAERDLAERFDVSRVTIREAEIALEAQGWISIKIGSGVYVKQRPQDVPGALPDVTAFDVTAARSVIEAEAAAMAASRITDEELQELEALVQTMSRPDASDQDAGEADRAFHLRIASITGNPAIEYVIRSIWRMRDELPQVSTVYGRVCHHDADDRMREHGAILDALRARDPAAARRTMHRHFQRLFEAMLEATESDALAEVRRRTQQHRERFQAVIPP